ncbi:hypothetical protein BD410DRAFT_786668 [Rickenella mellea]|uniref:Uncharacterized protein n=1 Tax=Rickenella mellea TaxID=50990 RepID=A0A4Y7QAT6_9AGAM|nr:hypothetical protein BD410DRAFT_786668 [Rickenella mellea]
MQPLLSLNESTLVFLPPHTIGSDLPKVAQVSVYAEGRGSLVESIASYFHVQRQISDLVMRVVCAHQVQPLRTPVNFEGNGYTVVANTKQWVYGETLRLKWGDEVVEPCQEKWTFTFVRKDPIQAAQ